MLEKHVKKVQSDDRYKDRPVYLIFCISDDYELSLEFWGERLETDDEYNARQKSIKEQTESQKKRDIDRLKYLASELGYDLVKK
jgi:hypothetical protein